jgi:hypothetical protein
VEDIGGLGDADEGFSALAAENLFLRNSSPYFRSGKSNRADPCIAE